MINRLILGAVAMLLPLGVSAQEPITKHLSRKLAPKAIENTRVSKLPSQWIASKSETASNLKADFTIKTTQEVEVVWSENFDAPLTDWSFESTNEGTTYWQVVENDTSDKKDFTTVDASSTSTLALTSHYRLPYETAGAISPSVTLPTNALLNFYVGYSRNWRDDCTTSVYITLDKGATWSKIWDTTELPSEYAAYHWFPIEVDLAEYAGKSAQFKLEYVGYMGDINFDNMAVVAPSAVTSVEKMTGDTIQLVDTSVGDIATWSWSMPGATPATSSEQHPAIYYTRPGSYDISLTVSNASGESSTITHEAIVTIEGVAPVAKIVPPTDLLEWSTKLPFVAPFHAVEYGDASTGFPTQWTWGFTGVGNSKDELYVSEEQNPTVNYMYRNNCNTTLFVENENGISQDEQGVFVDYGALVSNVREGDYAYTFDLGDGFGFFPGTNKLGITEYAEYYDKPARPALFFGVNVFFTNVRADEFYEQIQSVKVSFCKNENGLPGEEIDFAMWSIFELETADGGAVPTVFEFTKPILVEDDFFIVVSGLPEYSDIVDVRMATAKFRDHHNTAYLKTREGWRTAASYFPAGENHTSYYITPLLQYWAFSMLGEKEIVVDKTAGNVDAIVFSTFGYESPIDVDADWCRIVGEPGEYTVDTLNIEYDLLPAGIDSRTATFTISNGYEDLQFTVTQGATSGVEAAVATTQLFAIANNPVSDRLELAIAAPAVRVEVWSIAGKLVYQSPLRGDESRYSISTDGWSSGEYIVRVITNSTDESRLMIKR